MNHAPSVAANPPRSREARFALLALLAGAIAIAFSPIFVRLSDLGPVAVAFHRVALAVPALWLWMHLTAPPATDARGGRLNGRDVANLILAGAFFAGDLAFWHFSLAYTTVANSTLFANFAPIFVTLGMWLIFKERAQPLFLLGLALAIGGAVTLMGESVSLGGDHLFGDALGMITALFYAGYIITVGRLRARFPVALIMTVSSAVTAVVLLPIALLWEPSLMPQSLAGFAILLALAWFSHAGGQSLIAYALAHLPASFSSVSLLLQPVAAAVFAWVLLGEAIGPWQAAGGVIVLLGILLARRGSR